MMIESHRMNDVFFIGTRENLLLDRIVAALDLLKRRSISMRFERLGEFIEFGKVGECIL